MLLANGVDRIVPMFTDLQHRIDGELVTAAAEGFGDRRINFEAKFFGPFLAQIAFRPLIVPVPVSI